MAEQRRVDPFGYFELSSMYFTKSKVAQCETGSGLLFII